jgi:hypothetical protein
MTGQLETPPSGGRRAVTCGLVSGGCAAFASLGTMDDREAIELYDCAGEKFRGALAPVRWPDLAIEPENVARLVEGVLGSRCDFARLAFGDEFDAEAVAELLSEAWRTDSLQTRFAPEGVFVRGIFSIRVVIEPDDIDGNAEAVTEALTLTVELCLSFTHRHHTRPFVDFMSGAVSRASDGQVKRLDPFACEIAPVDAIAWGLNGVAP